MKKILAIVLVGLMIGSGLGIIQMAGGSVGDESEEYSTDRMVSINNIDEDTAMSQASDLMSAIFTESQGQLENGKVSYYLSSGSGGIAFSPGSIMMTTIEHDEKATMEEPRERFDRDLLEMELPSEPAPIKGNAIKLSFVDSDDIMPVGRDPVPWCNNYFIGNDPALWPAEVPNYRDIVYEDLWDGIDLVYYTKNGNMKYDFIVHPYADPTRIKVNVEGQDSISIMGDGSLKMGTGLGPNSEITDSDLDVFYADDESAKVSARFELNDNTYSFKLDGRDPSRTVSGDSLVYSTFLGGSSSDSCGGIAVDGGGYAY